MVQQFRAALASRFGEPLHIQDVPLPVPGPRQALVKLATSGVCYTNPHTERGQWPSHATFPIIPGHEGVGFVVQTGPGCVDLQVGDMVGASWLWSACGNCEYCRTGQEPFCPSALFTGYSVNGTYGEYMLVDSGYCIRIPKGTDPVAVTPILSAGVSAYKAVREVGVGAGQFVAISGVGGVGHLAVQYAVAMGLRVIALDVRPAKCELAKTLGAELVVDATKEDAGYVVSNYTGGGAHGVIITAGTASAYAEGLALVRRGGTVSFAGLPVGSIPINVAALVLKGITIKSSLVATRQDQDEALDFYLRGVVKPRLETCQLEEINSRIAAMGSEDSYGRTVVVL